MFGCDLNDLETSSLTFDGNGVELILVIFGLPYGGNFTWLFTFMVVTKRLILQGVHILNPMRGKDINTTIENYKFKYFGINVHGKEDSGNSTPCA